MDTLILILILNVAISILNCYVVGSAWKDVMTLGATFDKVLFWSAIIQSGVGFSMPVLLILTCGSVSFLSIGAEPYLTPAEATDFVQAISSLWYIAVILPILGSGTVIWIYSMREAYLKRDFASIATAGWNSFAQIHNTISFTENIGGAFGNVSEFFGAALDSVDDLKVKLVFLLILIVMLALVAGFMIAFGLVRYFSRTSESRIEQYAQKVKG